MELWITAFISMPTDYFYDRTFLSHNIQSTIVLYPIYCLFTGPVLFQLDQLGPTLTRLIYLLWLFKYTLQIPNWAPLPLRPILSDYKCNSSNKGQVFRSYCNWPSVHDNFVRPCLSFFRVAIETITASVHSPLQFNILLTDLNCLRTCSQEYRWNTVNARLNNNQSINSHPIFISNLRQ